VAQGKRPNGGKKADTVRFADVLGKDFCMHVSSPREAFSGAGGEDDQRRNNAEGGGRRRTRRPQ